MAEVLGPIVGSTRTMTMMHTPSDAFQAGPPGQSHLAPSRVSQMPRSAMYNTHIAGMGYRGPSALPVAPYAFQSTPHLRQDSRTLSAPVYRHSMGPPPSSRYQQEDSSSSSTASTASSSNLSSVGQYPASKDDSNVGIKLRQTHRDNRHSTALVASLSTPDLSLGSYDATKASPDRYRRISRRFEEVTNLPGSQQVQDTQAGARPHLPTSVSSGSQQTAGNAFSDTRQGSYDDASGNRQQSSTRYKRRSLGKMDSGPAPVVTIASPINSSVPTWSQVVAGRHNPALLPPSHRPVRHVRSSSGDLRGSSPRPSSARHSSAPFTRASAPENRPTTAPGMTSRARTAMASASTPDLTKRMPLSSPLSNPPKTEIEAPKGDATAKPSASPPPPPEPLAPQSVEASPAVQQLESLTEKATSKGMKSRLRRAFSFSSSQELRRATAENNMAAERAKLRKEKYESDREAEDAVVAAKQEAAGLGAGIYSNQGEFSVSTDNISISSTASSASIMLRKMGKGVKKSTRNLKNLFRPKSVIGSPAADNAMGEPGASTAELSLVTVEAEREKVNVNLDPHERPGGGTGYPKLERNSIDAVETVSSQPVATSYEGDPLSRKSIIGGERERAEVLAAVRKGILKRTGTSSTGSSPSVDQGELPVQFMPTVGRSAPGTPDRKSADGANKDYFMSSPSYPTGSTRSLPTVNKGNISFNSRVSFHDVWSASEYDRRGDIATCNRLTPMLAQQIKEELNSFKMEMEVHEESKPHTHFF